MCEKCHKEFHEENHGKVVRTNGLYEKWLEGKKNELRLDVVIQYLDSIINTRLYKEEQEKLKEILISNGNVKRNHNSLGMKKINEFFKSHSLPYIVSSKRYKTRKIRDKTFWVISRI